MEQEENKKAIIRLYEKTLSDYYHLLRLPKHWGMHYGFYTKPHQSRSEAILNTNKVLAQKAGVQKGMKVLDAGCGVGGSAIWLAKNIGANVTGITIVESHCQKAKEIAKGLNISDKTNFLARDFLKTGFPDNTFDIVWAIESVCHAEDKREFLTEAYRILKPGGRLILSDGFQEKKFLNPNEQKMMRKWLDGWAVPNLATINSFVTTMKDLGFKNIQYEDVTDNILPFSRWLYKVGIFIAYPITKLLELLHLRSSTGTGSVIAAIWQYRTLRKGLWAYVIFLGEK